MAFVVCGTGHHGLVRAMVAAMVLARPVTSVEWMSYQSPNSFILALHRGSLDTNATPARVDLGPTPSADTCASRCTNAPSCQAYTWVGPNVSTTYPGLAPYSSHCFVTNATGLRPTACNPTGCGMVSGWRVSSPWPTDGFDRLPTLWFGANETGLDSQDTLAMLGRHAVSGYAWQQGITTHGGRHSEVAQAEAAIHARDYLDSVGNDRTVLFVYRQLQIALSLFDVTRTAAANPANNHIWMHDVGNESNICRTNQPWGTSDPYWNFTEPDAVSFWLDEFIEEVCDEHAAYTTVYIDEVDSNWCGWWTRPEGGCQNLSESTLRSQAVATNAVVRQTVQKLNDCGIIPVLASFTVMKGSTAGGIAGQNPCTLWEDDLVSALDGLVWARFYEQWPDTFNMHHAGGIPDRFAQVISNGILESKAGIPVVAHTSLSNSPCVNDTSPPVNGSALDTFHIAAFYIAQGPSWVYGASNGWTDNQYCWRAQYNYNCGHPLGDAVRTGPYTFTRNFTRCDVAVNTDGLVGEIRLRAD